MQMIFSQFYPTPILAYYLYILLYQLLLQWQPGTLDLCTPGIGATQTRELDDADSGKLQYSAREAYACATLSNTNPTSTGTRLNLRVHSARLVTDYLNRDMD
jgi:hypothetical protein